MDLETVHLTAQNLVMIIPADGTGHIENAKQKSPKYDSSKRSSNLMKMVSKAVVLYVASAGA